MDYWIGNPSVSISNGTLRFLPLALPTEPLLHHANYLSRLRELNVLPSQEEGGRWLALCGIPNSKSPVEVLESGQLNEYRGAVTEARVVRTESIRYYAMLLQLKNSNCGLMQAGWLRCALMTSKAASTTRSKVNE